MSGTITFPPNPTIGQLFTAGTTTWQWNGTQWVNATTGANFLPLSGGALTGAVTSSSTIQSMGVTNGSNAAAGVVGEYNQTNGGPATMPNGGWLNTLNFNLPAGDWDVQGFCSFTVNGSALIGGAWVVSTSPTTPAGAMSSYANQIGGFTTAASTFTVGGPTLAVRFSVAVATSLYLLATCTFSGGNVQATTSIAARRVR